MSGAEPLVVIGGISSGIAIFDAISDSFKAAKSVSGLPKAFSVVREHIPLVSITLQNVKHILEDHERQIRTADDEERKNLEEQLKAAKPVADICNQNVVALRDILDKVVHEEGDNVLVRYRKAACATLVPGRKAQVEELMQDILKGLQQLQLNHFFSTIANGPELSAASAELADVPPSLSEEEEARFSNFGGGTQNNFTGSGMIYNQGPGGKMVFGTE